MAQFMDRVTVAQRLVTQVDIDRRAPQLRREAQERAERDRVLAERRREEEAREQERRRLMFQNRIQSAQQYLEQQNLSRARDAYLSALHLKPERANIINARIAEIDILATENHRQRQRQAEEQRIRRQAEDLMRGGSQHRRGWQIEASKRYFQRAAELVAETSMSQLIQDINSTIASLDSLLQRREQLSQEHFCNRDMPGWGNSLGTVSFVSDRTWRVGSQIWSDVVTATACQKPTFMGLMRPQIYSHHPQIYSSDNVISRGIIRYAGFSADCRTLTHLSGDLFSWCAVVRFANQLCPYPWRVPTREDITVLSNSRNPFTGRGASGHSSYWSSQELDANVAILTNRNRSRKDSGHALRCVRDR